MPMLDMVDLLAAADAKTLRTLAGYFAALAADCADRATAAERHAQNKARSDAELRDAIAAALTIGPLLDDGLDLEQAIDRVARRTGGRPDRILALWKTYGAQPHADAARAARAIEIMRLAGRGWSDAQIGRRVGLAGASVGAIISRQLGRRKAHKAKPPGVNQAENVSVK